MITSGKSSLDKDLETAVRYLRRRPEVKRIWLFGSAAKGLPLDWRSDLDFAVEGLPHDEIASAWSELDHLMSFPIDLIRWEEASPELRQQIVQWGKILYEG